MAGGLEAASPEAWLLRVAAALLLGLVVGSFANVCIHRLPLGLSVVRPRSRCPQCGGGIAAVDNVPVLSYLWLRGRCRRCRLRISARYPLVEAANGLVWAALAALGSGPRTLLLMAFATALIVLALIDLDHQVLPDVITLPGAALGLAASLLPGLPDWREALASALGGYLAFFAVAESYRLARGVEGLGQGDWKMAAMLGAFLGWEKLLLTVFTAALGGTLLGVGLILFGGRTAQTRLPLGTFLGVGALIALLAGDPVVAWYRRLLDG
jgi:leader peptidase (prepilin peptidase)/N-methyltransferase